ASGPRDLLPRGPRDELRRGPQRPPEAHAAGRRGARYQEARRLGHDGARSVQLLGGVGAARVEVTVRALLPILAAFFLAQGPEPPRAPFTRALLGVAVDSGYYAGEQETRSLSGLSRIARLVRSRAAKGGSRTSALNETIFADLGFVREVDDPDL